MIRFSIVIPCYNAERWLAAAIRSCLAQTARDLEVIVVDDGSTDTSREIAMREAAADARVKVITQENQGVGAARNAGLGIAAGEYVNFLDADDLFEPEKLAVQGAVLDENPAIDCVLCDGWAIDDAGSVLMDGLVDSGRLAGPVSLFDLFFSGGQFPPLIPLIRRRVAVALGGFDVDRRMSGWADTELWLRMGLARARQHFIDRRLCRYRITAGNMSSNHAAMELAAELVYSKLLRERPEESARALRFLHGRLQDNDAALAGLRTCVARADDELRAVRDEWRVSRETLHAERLDAQRLREQLGDANERLQHLRELVVRALPAAPGAGLRVGIFGTGAGGMKVWESLIELDTAGAVWFADNDPQQHGRAMLGLDVIAPASIPRRRYDVIVIGSVSRAPIHEQLLGLGVAANRILTPDLGGSILNLRRELVSGMAALLAARPAQPPAPVVDVRAVARLRDDLRDSHERLHWLRASLAGRVSQPPRRIVIAGIGESGQRLWEALAPLGTVDIVGFVDPDVRVHGRALLGVTIHPPQWLQDAEWDCIALAGGRADEWQFALAKAGVQARQVFELPVDGTDLAQTATAAAELFPDPLAGVLATLAPAYGLRVGIFGTGAAGLKVWEALAGIDTADAIWFADNNARQQGSMIFGLNVISPADIAASDADLIVIGSMSREPIRKQLIALGVRPEAILTPNASAPVDDLRRELASTLIAATLEQVS